MPLWKKLFVAAVLLLAITAGGLYGVPFVADLVGRGRRLTRTDVVSGPDDPDELTIEEAPEILAAQAGNVLGRAVSVEDYGLARMIRSEEPRAGEIAKAYLVHAAINSARRGSRSLIRELTVSSTGSRSGFFGRQTTRRYSTADDPYEFDLQIAEGARALHEAGTDPTGGAVKFYHKQAAEIVGVASFARVVEEWGREGLRPYDLPYAPIGLVFFKPGAA